MSRTLDIHAEYGVLASLLADASTYDRIASVVSAADFSATTNRTLYEVISVMIASCKPVDVLTVHSELRARGIDTIDLPALNAIAQSDVTIRGAQRYAEAVRIASLERQLRAAVAEADEVVDGDGELEQRTEAVAALFSGLQVRAVRRMPTSVHEIAINRIDHITALAQGEIQPGWKVGIPTLDRLLGGFKPGKVYVVAARPSVGKTSLSLQLALSLAEREQLCGLVLSQEMPNEELADRSLANLGHVDYGNLQTGQLTSDEWGRLTEGVEKLSRLPVSFDDEGGLTLQAIRTKARGVKGLRVLMIDYLQLCSGTGKHGTNRNSELEEISRGVKTLARELGIAVLLLSQLGRDVEKRANKEPELHDLRDSGAIEQDADAVIFLWHVRDFEVHGHRLIGCKVGKNRGGALGRFGLDFQGAYQQWRESDQDIRATGTTMVRGGRRGFHEADD